MRRAVLFTLIALVAASSIAGLAIGSEGHKIVFLNLTLVDGVVRLDNVNIVPGKLKKPKSLVLVPGRIHFTIVDAEGARLYEGVVRDPSNVRYEYVGEDGHLKSKWVTSDSASFFVRMPYKEGIRSARFSIIPGTPGGEGAQARAAKNLGVVEVDLKGNSDEE